jgi:hypothetical protein
VYVPGILVNEIVLAELPVTVTVAIGLYVTAIVYAFNIP